MSGLGDLVRAAPVLAPALAAAAVLVAGGRSRGLAQLVAVLGLGVTVGTLILTWNEPASGRVLGALSLDRFAVFPALVAALAVPGALVLWRDDRVRRLNRRSGERRRTADTAALALFAALGAIAATASGDLLTAAVALQLEALAATILLGLDRHDRSVEAAIKHALATLIGAALMVFGVAAVRAGAASTSFAAVGAAVAAGEGLVLLGAGFFLAGLFLRLAAVPFHLWLPDVWQGARAPALALVGAVTPAAGLAVLVRLLAAIHAAGGGGALRELTWWLAALSLVAASLAMLAQTRLRRLLAHGAVATVGTALVAATVLDVDADAARGVLALMASQALALGAIAAAVAPAEAAAGRPLEIEDLRIWRTTSPWAAPALAVGLAGWVGLPGTAGFAARVAIFQDAMRAGLATGDESFTLLAILGIVSALTGIYVHLRVLVRVFARPSQAPPGPALVAGPSTVLAVLCAAGVVWLGIGPTVLGVGSDGLLAWARAACEALR